MCDKNLPAEAAPAPQVWATGECGLRMEDQCIVEIHLKFLLTKMKNAENENPACPRREMEEKVKQTHQWRAGLWASCFGKKNSILGDQIGKALFSMLF